MKNDEKLLKEELGRNYQNERGDQDYQRRKYGGGMKKFNDIEEKKKEDLKNSNLMSNITSFFLKNQKSEERNQPNNPKNINMIATLLTLPPGKLEEMKQTIHTYHGQLNGIHIIINISSIN